MRMGTRCIAIRGDWGHLVQGQSMLWGGGHTVLAFSRINRFLR